MTPATESRSARVLVVDDEPAIAELYATWLSDDHDVEVVTDGESALDRVDETVDVVLLDRQMPTLSGDDVLTAMTERGLDCRVVMVTAIDPDFDIVEMPFDDYLTKPVGNDRLTATVEEMLARDRYDGDLQRYFAAAAKKATLETAKHRPELERSAEYEEISRRVEALEAEAAAAADEVTDPSSLFRDFPSGE